LTANCNLQTGPSACVVFLGCPKNQVDSEHVLGSLTEAGYTLSTDPRSADLIVITTCAFLQSAVRESEVAIEEALKLKRGGSGTRSGHGEPPMDTDSRADTSKKTIGVHPCTSVVKRSGSRPSESGCPTVVVAGCLVERYGAILRKKFPAVDLWVPLLDMPRIPQLISASPRLRVSASPPPRLLSTPRHFAYLKIADGCDNRCFYCMIPDIRGPFHSRPMPDIVAEARDLARAGVRELILVAQDTTLYGTDFRTGTHHQDTKTPSPKRSAHQDSASCPSCLRGSASVADSASGQSRLAELLSQLGRIDGIRWLRLMYTHPAHITEDVIDQFATNPKLCRYIDLPIQHTADHLLEKMNRRYTRQDIEVLLESLRAIPDMHIRTTIIVGLPGETARDFEELLSFVRSARFDRLSCYAYSPEPGTKAARLPGQVSPAVKKERVRRLMLAQAAISRASLKKLVGRELTALVDARDTDTEAHHQGTKTPSPVSGNRHSSLVIRHSSEAVSGLGRTEWDAPEIDGVVRLSGRHVRPGTFVRALITGSSTHDLTARIL
jgi:ribosomal protein S12 methylthiotransferase